MRARGFIESNLLAVGSRYSALAWSRDWFITDSCAADIKHINDAKLKRYRGPECHVTTAATRLGLVGGTKSGAIGHRFLVAC